MFTDDNISGALFDRPGLNALLAALGEFDCVVLSEQSRLGRETFQLGTVLQQIRARRVRLFAWFTDQEIRLSTAMDKMQVSLASYTAEAERESAGLRTRAALVEKAKQGLNAGGVVYGYDNRPTFTTLASGSQIRAHTEYVVNEREAATIRSIYTMYSHGYGHPTIARTLNNDPRPATLNKQFFGGARPAAPRGGNWSPSSIRGLLTNQRYVGVLVYGQRRTDYTTGKKTTTRLAEAEVRVVREDLRIVQQELWDAVQERLTEAKRTYLRDTKGRLWGRPGRGIASKYLLTSLAACGECQSALVVCGGSATIKYYACGRYLHRGTTACTNSLRVRTTLADETVLSAVENTLSPAGIGWAVTEATRQVSERLAGQPDQSKRLAGELKDLQRKHANFLAAVGEGIAPTSVMREIAKLERQITTLEGELAACQYEGPGELEMGRIRKDLAGTHGRVPQPPPLQRTAGAASAAQSDGPRCVRPDRQGRSENLRAAGGDEAWVVVSQWLYGRRNTDRIKSPCFAL